jgi:streptogramin lyase
MFFERYWQGLKGNGRRARGRRPAPTRPRVEVLEGRCLPSVTINEFPIPTAGSGPTGIALGPDGNLWFTEGNAGKIGVINPTTHAFNEFSTPTASSGPASITAGPDGNLWFTERGASKIGVINPTTHVISEFSTPTAGSLPEGITAGPDGNLWFTEEGQATVPGTPSQIGVINPTTHAISEFPTPTANSQPFAITAGPDGNLWFTETGLPGQFGVINPSTHAITEIAGPSFFSLMLGITAGPDGNLWFTEANPGKVGEINPSTHAISDFALPPGAWPLGITAGPDGNLWFTESIGNKVGEIKPSTHAVNEFTVPTALPSPTGPAPNFGPWGITSGPDGNLWFTEATQGQIGELVLPHPPASITAASGSGQSATVTDAFASPLVVTVKDQYGNPVPGASVTFTAPASGPSGTFSNGKATITETTDANGQLSEAFTANTAAGAYAVTASVAGVLTPASFSLTNNPGAPAVITATSGSGQSAYLDAAFAAPLVVTVTDAYGNVVPGVTVSFTAPGTGPGGTFSNGLQTITATTDANGQASEAFTANLAAGGYSVTASAAGVLTPASFSLTNVIPPPQQEAQVVLQKVQDLAAAGVLNGGQSNSLLTKLMKVTNTSGRGQVNAFLNEVQAMVDSGMLTQKEAQPLLDGAQIILMGLP